MPTKIDTAQTTITHVTKRSIVIPNSSIGMIGTSENGPADRTSGTGGVRNTCGEATTISYLRRESKSTVPNSSLDGPFMAR
jgi:hypothetical protein